MGLIVWNYHCRMEVLKVWNFDSLEKSTQRMVDCLKVMGQQGQQGQQELYLGFEGHIIYPLVMTNLANWQSTISNR